MKMNVGPGYVFRDPRMLTRIKKVDVIEVRGIFATTEKWSDCKFEVFQSPKAGPKTYMNRDGDVLDVTRHIRYTLSYRLLTSAMNWINRRF